MSKLTVYFKNLAALSLFLPLTVLAQSPAPKPYLSDVKSLNSKTSKIDQAKPTAKAKVSKSQTASKKSAGQALSQINAKLLQSAEGGMNSGGGDECETRIQEIRDDIRSWIQNGGHESLTYATSSKNEYAQSMLSYLKTTKNLNGSISPATQIECVHRRIRVQGHDKTCRFDQRSSRPKITCDHEAFMDKSTMSEDAQYRLIHHEYAGLAGLEIPKGSQSQYQFSDQLSAYLVTMQVRKLAIKPVAVKPGFGKDAVNTVQAIHNAAPGLTSKRIAYGFGQKNNSKNANCILLYKNEDSKIKMTLILNSEVTEIELDSQLVPYEDVENAEVLAASYNETLGQFSYSLDYGTMTNQYTGAHSYGLKFEKKSEASFLVSYFHGWADDDGFSGEESYSCLLETKE